MNQANESTSGLLSLGETIARLGITRSTCYRWLREGRLQGVKAGRQWRFRQSDIERFLKGEEEVELSQSAALDYLQALGHETDPQQSIDALGLLKAVIKYAFALRCTDLHLEPDSDAVGMRLRIDGVLESACLIAGIIPSLAAHPQADLRLQPTRTAAAAGGRVRCAIDDQSKIDLRCCFLPTMHGEAMVLRIVNQDDIALVDIDRMGFMPDIARWLIKPYGAQWFNYCCWSNRLRQNHHPLCLGEGL